MTLPDALWIFACALALILGFMIGYALRADKAANEKAIEEDTFTEEGQEPLPGSILYVKTEMDGFVKATDKMQREFENLGSALNDVGLSAVDLGDPNMDIDHTTSIQRLMAYEQIFAYPPAGGRFAVAEADLHERLDSNIIGQMIIERARLLNIQDIELTMEWDDDFHRYIFTWGPEETDGTVYYSNNKEQ